VALTQFERSERTRTALLQATLECIASRGLAGTTTPVVAAVAGVSRGAQVHHFPTKRDLIIACLRYALSREKETFRSAFASLPAQSRTLEGAVRTLWEIFEGPGYKAVLELVVAARTDPDIYADVQQAFKGFIDEVVGLFSDLFRDQIKDADPRIMVSFAFATVAGAALLRDLGLTELATGVVNTLAGLAELSSSQQQPQLEVLSRAGQAEPVQAAISSNAGSPWNARGGQT
jgi:AcrR family transcriptional regulator